MSGAEGGVDRTLRGMLRRRAVKCSAISSAHAAIGPPTAHTIPQTAGGMPAGRLWKCRSKFVAWLWPKNPTIAAT